MNFSLEHITCGYGKEPVLRDISFSIKSGEILCILGPNGVGKTTLFKSALGLIPSVKGNVKINGDDIGTWSNRHKAEYIGYIPQTHIPPFPYTVFQVVVMGCVAQRGMLASPDEHDYETAENALEELEIGALKDRIYTELSGGERQMVLIARALAQNPKILLMDEPTANLDYGNQARVLEQIKRLAGKGMIVVMTTHAPDHVFLCSSKVILVERENRISIGRAEDIVTEENLERAYGIKVSILKDERNGELIRACVPVLNKS